MKEIHPQSRLNRVMSLAKQRRKAWCEIKRVVQTSGGFGETDSPDFFAGRVKCAVSVASQPGEDNNNGSDVDSVSIYEITVPIETVIEPNDRIAVPAFYPSWKPTTAYKMGALVVPANWVSGAVPVLECVRPGVSSAKEPRRWPVKLRAAQVDGACVWRVSDRAVIYEVLAVNLNESNPIECVATCKELN